MAQGRLRAIIETRALRRWLSFGAAGMVAFGVDMGVLGVLVHGLGMVALRARLISIPMAASTAWMINRRFTFVSGDDRARWHQWLRYLAVNTINVSVNYGGYVGLVSATAIGAAHPLISVVPGALLGLWGNYLLAGRWVFRDPSVGLLPFHTRPALAPKIRPGKARAAGRGGPRSR
ncbi:MAG: GtrA family protein [Salinisphaera sp.]|uniref:GtrA family protein n=1 Tax=Salinisphaera sp. TaxID=1914330 RepID=UPI003C7AC559